MTLVGDPCSSYFGAKSKVRKLTRNRLVIGDQILPQQGSVYCVASEVKRGFSLYKHLLSFEVGAASTKLGPFLIES